MPKVKASADTFAKSKKYANGSKYYIHNKIR
jgi:hypothetical protein